MKKISFLAVMACSAGSMSAQNAKGLHLFYRKSIHYLSNIIALPFYPSIMRKILYISCLITFMACSKENKNSPFCDTLNNYVEEFMDSVHSEIINISFFRKDNKDYAYIRNAYEFDTLHTDYYIETNKGYYSWKGGEYSNKRLITVSFDTYINHQDVFDATKATKYEGNAPKGWPTDVDVMDGCLKDKAFLIKSKDSIQPLESFPTTRFDGNDNLSSYITNPYLSEYLCRYIIGSGPVMYYLIFLQYEGNDYVLIDGPHLYIKQHLKGFFFYQTELVLCYSLGDLYKKYVNVDSLIIPYNGRIPGYKEREERYERNPVNYTVFKINKDGKLEWIQYDWILKTNIIHQWEHL